MKPQEKAQSVLHKIGETARKRVEEQKKKLSEGDLRKAVAQMTRKPNPFVDLFRPEGLHVIAEIKLASPSKGDIAPELDPLWVAEQYLSQGARALSVLTEPYYFKGNLEYLRAIRQRFPEASLLQKDFLVEPYQIYEAALAGADAILIIVALLSQETSALLLKTAQELGLGALVEVHNREELEIAKTLGAPLIGINNRNLKDLSISLDTTRELLPYCPSQTSIICESGLSTHEDLTSMRAAGCHGFLVGTSLMKTGEPGLALGRLLHGTR
jgi:indole-3-glycerol phosphate synthase